MPPGVAMPGTTKVTEPAKVALSMTAEGSTRRTAWTAGSLEMLPPAVDVFACLMVGVKFSDLSLAICVSRNHLGLLCHCCRNRVDHTQKPVWHLSLNSWTIVMFSGSRSMTP